jgi:Domain of Unknown Function (DUF928)
MKTPHRIKKIARNFCLVTILLLSTLLTTTTFPTFAKPNLKIRWKPPTPPSSLGIPGNRAQGGGTRSERQLSGITALVPKLNRKVRWGRTISDRPTVWLNAPQGLAPDLLIEIAVREQNGKLIAKQLFTTSSKISPGAISISFPSAAVLEIDHNYQWSVALYSKERVDRPFLVQGQIQRVAAPIAITTAKSSWESIQILAENGIWYDALTQLGDHLRQTKDQETSVAWTALLKSAGISGSNQIQDCCQFE